MNIQSVNDKAFEVYGRVVDGYDYAELLATWRSALRSLPIL